MTSWRTEVWAPRAARVDVVVADGGRHRLEADPASGWHVGGPTLVQGDRYAFSLDGSEPLPDPRSRSQPEGVDGPSAVDDPTRFAWTDGRWPGRSIPGAVLYELHVGTFSEAGTFDGAVEHLDHLVDLGVDAVEVMPVAEFMGDRGWGYDGVALWAPHHRYGGPEGFRRFVDACHGQGLAVVLDVVYNHLGPRGNHLGRFGPYFTDAHHTPWGAAVNLDGAGSADVRRFLLDNARHWFVDHHIDGLRLDATDALADDSPLHVLAQLAAETALLAGELGRPLSLIAEREREELLPIRPVAEGGWGLDARWSDDLHHAIHAALTGEGDGYYVSFGSLADIATATTHGHVRPGDVVPDTVSSHRFVVCSQNHDQVGNRALGDRLAHLVGTELAMAAAAIVLAGPATPLLFQGEEWAASTPFPYFCDTDDPDLAAAIRTGRREEFAAFGWDPEAIPDPLAPATMASAVLRWAERDIAPHDRVLAWYRTLLRLRRERPDLADGSRRRTTVEADDEARTLVLRRARTAVAVNVANGARSVAVGRGTVLASTVRVPERVTGTLRLPPLATVVVGLDPRGRGTDAAPPVTQSEENPHGRRRGQGPREGSRR